MKRVWHRPVILGAGLVVSAFYAMPQAYTISAKPGAVNYIEGHVALNGTELSQKALRSVFLNANDTLTTSVGKAEVLLTPGAFLRMGDNSGVRMVAPSLTDAQVEITRGEAMVEVDGLLKENHLTVLDHGATITIDKNGLYRFTADQEPTAGVIDGKALVYIGEKKTEIGKGHEMLLADSARPKKFDAKREDDLYAWSNVRSQYDAASSYQAATNMSLNNTTYAGWPGFGLGAWYGPGWYWNGMFNGWAWVPADGAFFSPFGWGFYGLGYLPYAPVVYAPLGGWYNGNWVGGGGGSGTKVTKAAIPVNPHNPPAIGKVAASPAAYSAARAQTAQALAATGLQTANGTPVSISSSPQASGLSMAHGSGGPSMMGTAASHGSGGGSGHK